MYHGLRNDYLYSAFKITASHDIDGTGKLKKPTGTCFFVSYHNIVILVTNRHVLDAAYKDSKYIGSKLSKIEIDGWRSNGSKIHLVCAAGYIQKAPGDADVVCIVNPGIGVDDDQPLPPLDFAIPIDMIATEADFQDLSVCDFVAFPGFPELHDQVAGRPIMRTGTIASDPRFDYSHREIRGTSTVAFEGFSHKGSSGSPVFSMQQGLRPGKGISFDGFRPTKLLGINSGHLSNSEANHAGLSYFYKSTVILRLIADALRTT